MTTFIYSHDACLEHRPGPRHPESPARFIAVNKALKAPEFESLQWQEGPLGTREQVTLIHEPTYFDMVQASAPQEGYVVMDSGDTVMSPGSWEAVMRCVGAACAATDAVMRGEAQNAFCAMRPCGHHAEPAKAMGFCMFNQAAIAAAYVREAYQLARVAVVDFDVHHGNGTQEAFYHLPEMFYTSSHQSPFYPGTGQRSETGVSNNILNIPLKKGCSSETFRQMIEGEMFPALRQFKPEFIVLSAGFDAHRLDPLAGLNLETEDFHWITTQLMDIADEMCKGRIVSVLEGGYHLQALADSAAAHVRALTGR
jgi:acetoin utilization deacetylase AcuC-like enzyme